MKKYILITFFVALAACTSRTTSEPDHPSHDSGSNTPTQSVDHNEADDRGNLDHSSMQTSPGAESAPMELQFIDTMIVHHQGAIDMAKLAETRAQDAGVKELASNIGREQELEIATMDGLRMKWFGAKEKAINMNFPGMSEAMGRMDLKKLSELQGRDFDIEFVKQMIPHHEGALAMAKQVRNTDSYAELRTLADNIISSQDAEIKKMQDWRQAWDSK